MEDVVDLSLTPLPVARISSSDLTPLLWERDTYMKTKIKSMGTTTISAGQLQQYAWSHWHSYRGKTNSKKLSKIQVMSNMVSFKIKLLNSNSNLQTQCRLPVGQVVTACANWSPYCWRAKVRSLFRGSERSPLPRDTDNPKQRWLPASRKEIKINTRGKEMNRCSIGQEKTVCKF